MWVPEILAARCNCCRGEGVVKSQVLGAPRRPAEAPPGYFDLDHDHDQRLSGLGSVVYSQRGLYLSATGIYGSGLTNGNDPDSTYGTGLFDFNKSIKVDPSFGACSCASTSVPDHNPSAWSRCAVA